MRLAIEDRTRKHALLFIKRDMTIRKVAEETGWSKQTVYHDLSVRLKEINIDLFKKVQEKLKDNKYIGQLRGGYTTQERFTGKKKMKDEKKAKERKKTKKWFKGVKHG